jgi:ubiquinone/menaquinone biosynthesis C-methylase UbiE
MREPITTVNGIPLFSSDDFFFSSVLDINDALSLVELAKKYGWRRAIHLNRKKFLSRYIMYSSRFLFSDLLDTKPGCKILDLGAGWGSLSIHFAKRYPTSTIYAFDKTLERLLFLQVVREQEALGNIRIARVDATDIPLKNASMDIVILIGVLEWVGVSNPNLPPRRAQELVLSEVKRVLKQDGKLVIGIENRYGFQYLLGRREHSGIRFGSIMPKKLVNVYTKTRYHKEYRTYIYSYGEYKNLLEGLGFKKLRFYAAFPDYRLPVYISDKDGIKEIMRSFSKRTVLKMASRLPSGFLMRIAPSYFIIGEI